MAFASKIETEINWDERNYNQGRLGIVRQFSYKNKEGLDAVGKVVGVGEEMIESILRDMKKFGEAQLSIFINEDKKGREVLSFKVDEKFKKEKESKDTK